MTRRRDFLAALGGMLGASVPAARLGGIRRASVEASATVFHGHPDGRTTLVRFVASEIDAPAGRLRVFDRGGRLVGTAGMLRRGADLLGELWLQLDGPTRITSELETPVTRRPLRTAHVVTPSPRWTVHWVTIAHPDDLAALLGSALLTTRGAVAHAYAAMGVRANPVVLPGVGRVLDHLDVARMAVPAARLERTTGIPPAAIGMVPPVGERVHLDGALAGSGIAAVIDTSEAIDPAALGFGNGVPAMQRRLAEWLALGDSNHNGSHQVVVVGRDPERVPAAYAAVSEWNSQFAFPHIEVGDTGAAPALAAGTGRAPEHQAVGVPDRRELDRLPQDRAEHAARRAAALFAPLAAAIAPTDPTLEGIARRFAFPVSGVLVFNPSPFGRSDVVTPPDGALRVVTDVPALGYAFVPDAAQTSPSPQRSAATVRSAVTDRFRAVIQERTGAIISLVDHATGRELAGGAGLNAVAGAVLEDSELLTLPDVGQQLVLRRRLPAGTLTTTVTLYDTLPWVDVENRTSLRGSSPIEYRFAFADPPDTSAWEVAGGVSQASPPVDRLRHLRWIALRQGAGAIMLGTPDTAYASIDGDGQLAALAGDGGVRFRLMARDPALGDDPWRLGWSVEPLRAVRTSGTGPDPLPSFGRMLEVRDPGAAVLALRPADDGVGLIAYVQELMGVPRTATLQAGVLTFREAVHTDLTERDIELLPVTDGTVAIPLTAFGFTAVRLLGIGRAP